MIVLIDWLDFNIGASRVPGLRRWIRRLREIRRRACPARALEINFGVVSGPTQFKLRTPYAMPQFSGT
eukprot:5179535-Alexandrium_andersonii.AAC.1